MLNLYSIFVYYVLFYQKKLPTSQKTPHHFPAEVGSTPHTPPSETAPVGEFKISLTYNLHDFSILKLILQPNVW